MTRRRKPNADGLDTVLRHLSVNAIVHPILRPSERKAVTLSYIDHIRGSTLIERFWSFHDMAKTRASVRASLRRQGGCQTVKFFYESAEPITHGKYVVVMQDGLVVESELTYKGDGREPIMFHRLDMQPPRPPGPCGYVLHAYVEANDTVGAQSIIRRGAHVNMGAYDERPLQAAIRGVMTVCHRNTPDEYCATLEWLLQQPDTDVDGVSRIKKRCAMTSLLSHAYSGDWYEGRQVFSVKLRHVFRLLALAGASLVVPDQFGQNGLHYIAGLPDTAGVAEFLTDDDVSRHIKKYASHIFVQDREGHSPMDICTEARAAGFRTPSVFALLTQMEDSTRSFLKPLLCVHIPVRPLVDIIASFL